MNRRGVSRAILRPLSTVLAIGVGAALCMAQAPDLHQITASDAENYDHFGNSLDLDGNVMVVGAWDEDAGGTNAGAAYVFRFDGTVWNEEQKLTAPSPDAYDNYGISVAVSGNRVVVGAHLDDDAVGGADTGAVYVYLYDGSTWNLEIKLQATDLSTGDKLGQAVAIDGDALIAGAPGVDHTGADTGAAYVFRHHVLFGWREEQKILATDFEVWDGFGAAVDIQSDRVLVGANKEDAGGFYDAGSAYLYLFDGSLWQPEQKISASDKDHYDDFAFSVALDGNRIAIGAYNNDDEGASSGAAYVFHYDGSTWTEQTKLLPGDAIAYDYFGYSVDVAGPVVVVGAYGNDEAGAECGAMYSYANLKGNWALDMKYAPRSVVPYDYCGVSVSISGNRAVAGATGDDTAGYDAGAACVFSVGEFLLSAVPANPSQGDTLTLTSSYGWPNAPVALFTTDVNGVPFFHMLIWAAFSADHQFHLSAPVPPGLGGLDVGFLTIKLDGFGKAALSDVPRVVFQ